MNLNLPADVRKLLYVIITIGGPIVIYLTVSGRIGENEVALWTGLASAVALMAGLNVTPDAPKE